MRVYTPFRLAVAIGNDKQWNASSMKPIFRAMFQLWHSKKETGRHNQTAIPPCGDGIFLGNVLFRGVSNAP